MKLVNATKNKTLATDLKQAVTFWDRLLGLIDKRNPRALLFQTRFGLHTFFLDKPIDIIVLDSNNRASQLRSKLPPYSFFFYNPIHNRVLELPAGSLKNTGTTIGDKILFE